MTSATVIYDSDCGFCKVCLAVLLAWDRAGRKRGERGRPSPGDALRPLPLGAAEADRLLADIPPEDRASSWHLVLDDGTLSSAGAGLAPALRLLPGGRVPAAVFAHFPGATERGYRWVAGHRTFLGRFVPAGARRWADGVITRSLYP